MINLDGIEMSDETREKLSDIFEKLMAKYEGMSNGFVNSYYSGVIDGINHCYKVVNGVVDDYLDGINESINENVTIKKFSEL